MSEALRILKGDCRETLQTLAAESVHCIVTSPPYHGLRNYGTGRWEGGDANCHHQGELVKRGISGGTNQGGKFDNPEGVTYRPVANQYGGNCRCGAVRVDQQIGLEASVAEHINALVEVFRECKRVLRKDSVMCVNYGDAYATGANGRKAADIVDDDRTFRDKPFSTTGELPAKNLLMLPFRLALALQADGWVLRSVMPWVKRNSMPESARDRPSNAIEYVFLFSKSARYHWDQDAVRRPMTDAGIERFKYAYGGPKNIALVEADKTGPGVRTRCIGMRDANPNGRNLRNSDFYFDSLDLVIRQVKAELAHLEHLREHGGLLLSGEEPLALDVNPQASKVSHYACFPEALVTPLIMAGTSEWGCCSHEGCGAPWVRVVEKGELVPDAPGYKPRGKSSPDKLVKVGMTLRGGQPAPNHHRDYKTLGWQPSCKHEAPVIPCTVLDPFSGSGTTLLVANRLGRRAIGCELSEDYIEISNRKNSQQTMLFTEVG